MGDPSYDVRVRKIYVYRGTKTTTYWVRWSVAGASFKRPYKTKALADSARAELLSAARRGEAFDTEDGLPVSVRRQHRGVNWLDFAQRYADSRWKDDAATSRRSRAEALSTVTFALLRTEPEPSDAKRFRATLQRWVFNTKARTEHTMPPEVVHDVSWLRRHSPDLTVLTNIDTMRRVLDALGTNLDGSRSAPNYFNRRRATLHHALEYAVRELKVLDSNPMHRITASWVTSRKTRSAVDRRTVVNPSQAAALLDALDRTAADGTPLLGPSAPRLKAFFATMYYAALRPEEAANLREINLELPTEGGGWGWIHLSEVIPDVGGAWTDSGHRRDQRGQLKHRGVGDGRTVPCPPPLTDILRQHLKRFGTDSEGRLFSAVRRPGPVAGTTYCKVWSRVRRAVLTPEQVASPLAKEPYSLRHAAVSTWLNAGVDPAQVAEWAGHSKKVLLEVYAKCLDGRQDIARDRIAAVLDIKEQGSTS